MKFSILNFQAAGSDSFSSSLNSCFDQLSNFESTLKPDQYLIKISVFAACSDTNDYRFKKQQVILSAGSLKHKVPISLISQPPLDKKITLEVWMLDQIPSGTTINYKSPEEGSYLCVDHRQFNLLISTHQCNEYSDSRENIQQTFQHLDKVLHNEGFHYGDIVRQWNYIENITLSEDNNGCQQNYQLFNDCRTAFYKTSEFPHGYPAATGIGVENGGCLIDLMALKTKAVNYAVPIGNFLQTNASNYSHEVLVGKALNESQQLSTPKFERAKFVNHVIDGFFYISGTASIIGEKTVFENDVANQTLTTLQNISYLISQENLSHSDIDRKKNTLAPNSYRVYIKKEADYPVVKAICDQYFQKDVGVFVKADVCRNNLLVEIEATYLVI